MINRIRTRLILIIISAIVFSILSISLIIHYNLSKTLDIYLEQEQQNRIVNILEIVKRNYELENSWSVKSLENIKLSPIIQGYDIVIKDKNNNIILTNYIGNDGLNNHMQMMSRMKNMMNRKMGEYKLENHEIIVNDKLVGKIEIGYLGPFMISNSEIDLITGINSSILYAALFSISLAILIGMFFSSYFTKPIMNITKAANNIREGKLEETVNTKTNIIELRDLSDSINHLAKSLNNAQILRKRLTSDIAHELRTPLTILKSHLEAINDGIWEPTKERLENFYNEVIRLIKLVEEMKYLNDIENHKLVINNENVNLSKLIFEVLEKFRYEFESKNININNNIKEDIYINGDINKLNQIFINLLSNAVKFTNNSGEVSVSLFKKEDFIIIKIQDNGIGISSNDLPYIFERLYRGDVSRNRKTGGSGIGLTITKTLIEAHNGNIEVESEEGIGTKFIIRFPENS